MILQYLRSFKTDYRRLPREIQSQVDRAIVLLQRNPGHPSLQVKKIRGTKDVWEGRVTRASRFTFDWEGNVITFRRVGTHNILKKETR